MSEIKGEEPGVFFPMIYTCKCCQQKTIFENGQCAKCFEESK